MVLIAVSMVVLQLSSVDRSYADMNEELYGAIRRALLSLESFTGLLLAPSSPGEDENQLRLLQQEVKTQIESAKMHI